MMRASFLSSALTLAFAFGALAASDPRDTYSTNGWERVWSEEFDGTDVDWSTWRAEQGFVRNKEVQYYTDRRTNVFCTNGTLVLRAYRERLPNAAFTGEDDADWRHNRREAHFSSASVTTRRTFLYGRIEIRCQMPCRYGAWPALWTLGDSLRKPKSDPEATGWPQCGEIDLVEMWNDSFTVHSNVHSAKDGRARFDKTAEHAPKPHCAKAFDKPGERPCDGFHVFTFDWYADRLVMFYDGRFYGCADLRQLDWPNGDNPFRKPQYLLMNLALCAACDEVDAAGNVVKSLVLPMEMVIDYVRYYRR